MPKKKKGLSFRNKYLIYLGVLAVLVISSLIYVNALLVDYEASQPSNIAESALAELKTALAEGKAESKFAFSEVGNTKFGTGASSYAAGYIDSLSGKELTLKPGGISYTGDKITYEILADGEKAATMILESTKTKTKLLVFTMSDWKMTKIVPAVTVTAYSYKLELPESFGAFVNGIALGNDELVSSENGISTYKIDGLLAVPEFKVTDSDGNEAFYDIAENVLRPVVYEYKIMLPESIALSVNGKPVTPEKKENGIAEYSLVRAAKPTLTADDGYGNSVTVQAGDEIKTYTHTVSVPEGYTVTLGGKALTGGVLGDNPAYKYLIELGITVPKQQNYSLTLLSSEGDFSVTDESGAKIEAKEVNCNLTVNRHTGGGKLPDALQAEVDVLEIARTWSKFMTQDLYGDYNGFASVAKYLKKDSYLYGVAWQWATGVDITFTSTHVLGNPPFYNENVTNYTRFSDNCFSVDVSLVKVMHLNSGLRVDDKLNATFYFVNDGGWFVADIIDITE